MASSAASGLFSRSNPGNGASMRGLVSFIADLRNARARELEEKRINKELANIRQKFKDGNMNGYAKKKYVCKLLYIYILGWNVDFGHLEAVNLISATKYSEKQIGYLAVTLFLHEEHPMMHLVINSLRKDLLNHNELNNCLALHAIANVGGREMGEALSADVHSLLISPTSTPFVKKKAALTLLRLYRKYPSMISPDWAERIISLMGDPDMGVALSVTSLVMALAQDSPDQYKGSYVKAARLLHQIAAENGCASDYYYYKVPCPWLQVKLLRLLQYYPPGEDHHVRVLMRRSLQRIMDSAMEMPKNVQQNNAQNAVLFEAINLIIHLDTERELMVQISTRLGKFIQSRETNVRYLGLEAMTHLAARSETLDPIKKHQSIIIGSLRDRDISVRRQGLDLLYSMCDSTNAQPIVSELMKYLQTADYAIREEMVLKIAILTEKYATDIQWYVDVSLRLLAMAGDHVSDEVWQRIIQIVSNNEGLQVYAAQNILRHIKSEQCHETLIKIGGYLLGEFGHLIADNEGCSPVEQYMALSSKFQSCSPSTRAILLSSFIKFVNLFPEIKPRLLRVFELYSHSLDSELQQRACEYLALATMPSDDLLRTVCDEMPPFPERNSALLSRLHQKHSNASEKRIWIVGGRDANKDSKEVNISQHAGIRKSFTMGNFINVVPENKADVIRLENGSNGTTKNGIDELSGLDLNQEPPPMESERSLQLPSTQLSPDWEIGYNRLILQPEGILYEDPQIQVGLRTEYRFEIGCIIIYYTNRASYPIGSLITTLEIQDPDRLKANTKGLPGSEILPAGQTQQMVMFEAKNVFEASPTIRISYAAGSHQTLILQLPIALHKYMDAAELSSDDFFKRWKQIGGGPRESQRVFGLVSKKRFITIEHTRKVVKGFNWSILDGIDPNTKNVVGASVLSTSKRGKFGCLLRLEPNLETMMYRLTVRATDEIVPSVLVKFMEDRLSQGDPSSGS